MTLQFDHSFILHSASLPIMLSQVVELIEAKRKFAITSHVRPDGDSLGSSLGLCWLLRALDKDVEVIMRDPGASRLSTTSRAPKRYASRRRSMNPYHAVFVIECSDITRPGLIDLEKQFVVNIDHHSTTALFGKINWIDSTASACRRNDLQPLQGDWAYASPKKLPNVFTLR